MCVVTGVWVFGSARPSFQTLNVPLRSERKKSEVPSDDHTGSRIVVSRDQSDWPLATSIMFALWSGPICENA